MTGFIAVHCGAGEQKRENFVSYNKLSKRACVAGIKILNNGGSALEAVREAVVVLENNPLTNAGYGSNLTTNGVVETDAALMDGKTLLFGGCGAVPRLKNPIALAYNICVKQNEISPYGLVPPSLLVGKGALEYAKSIRLKIVRNKDLIAPRAYRQFKKYNSIVNKVLLERMDTVGAVCIDNNGNISSALSSGGLILKRPGRVGQAALYASGIWADSFDLKETSVAVCTSGCGEHLVQTLLAREIANDLKQSTCPTTDLHKSMTDRFLNSRHLSNVKQRLAGALVLHRSQTGEGSVLWSHTTSTMSIGYMSQSENRSKALISQLPIGYEAGSTVTVGGSHF